jgi:hypothetical protein
MYAAHDHPLDFFFPSYFAGLQAVACKKKKKENAEI